MRSRRSKFAGWLPTDDLTMQMIATLLAEADITADSVLRAIREDLAAQEKVVLSEYLRVPEIKQVAMRLGKREQTIRNQLASIREKLRVGSLNELLGKVLLAHLSQELRRVAASPASVPDLRGDPLVNAITRVPKNRPRRERG